MFYQRCSLHYVNPSQTKQEISCPLQLSTQSRVGLIISGLADRDGRAHVAVQEVTGSGLRRTSRRRPTNKFNAVHAANSNPRSLAQRSSFRQH